MKNQVGSCKAARGWALLVIAAVFTIVATTSQAIGAIEKEAAANLQLPADFSEKELLPLFEQPAPAKVGDGKPAPVHAIRAAHVGENRLLFKISFAGEPRAAGTACLVYLDLDDNRQTGRTGAHEGIDVMVVLKGKYASLGFYTPEFSPKNTTYRYAWVQDDLYITLSAPLPRPGDKIAVRAYVASEREVPGGKRESVGTKQSARLELPRSKRAVELLWNINEKPPTSYRFINKVVKYERLEDKGLNFEDVAPAQPFVPAREKPRLPFDSSVPTGPQTGSIDRQQVLVSLLEEAGVDRAAAHISFGLPLPRGGLFDLRRIALLDKAGQRLPIQIVRTSNWLDGSIKWALIDAQVALAAGQAKEIIAQFGNQVDPAPPASSPLRFEQDDNFFMITTGPARFAISKQSFNVLDRAWHDRNGDGDFTDSELVLRGDPGGVTLIDEAGQRFSSAARRPERVEIEESGPQKLVLRVEGAYAQQQGGGEKYMRFVTRLTFLAGSPVVTVAHTHINDYLRTEFTDIQSLSLGLQMPGEVREATLYAPSKDGKLQSRTGPSIDVFQSDENTASANAGEKLNAGRCPGLFSLATSGGKLSAIVHEFWQRWPKQIHVQGRDIELGLLPPQPSADYGKDLPYHLMYPFVSGKYRFKWGSAFTTRFSFDVSGKIPAQELAAQANQPVIAVLPASWYAHSGGLDEFAVPSGKQFSIWDDYIARSYEAHLKRRDQQREYGYMNYGDFFGERGRNWGNNEYDRAHAFFMQFARTGNRNYFRLAMDAARHQADSDIVHAYPDGYYVGANHQHSIGHTGEWSQVPSQAKWSHKYDAHTDASNGHTWSHGMVDAWFLAGESRAMECAQELGEHICAMAPRLKALGTHERSGGWSLRAAMGLYRVSYDSQILKAADQLVDLALRSQKPDQGGAWPHELPLDHAAGQRGVLGNSTYNIAILLNGLKLYHEQTGRADVLQSLKSGAGWIVRAWDEQGGAWPYSATVDGKPASQPSPTLNFLVASPVAYVGMLSGDQAYMNIARRAMEAPLAQARPESFGKSIAQQMVYTPEVMYCLQKYWDKKDPAAVSSLLAAPR